NMEVVEPFLGNVYGNFIIHLSKPSQFGVTVEYRTKDVTAKQYQDYIPVKGTLFFPPLVTELNVPVTILANGDTADETFQFGLYNPVDAVIKNGISTGLILEPNLFGDHFSDGKLPTDWKLSGTWF